MPDNSTSISPEPVEVSTETLLINPEDVPASTEDVPTSDAAPEAEVPYEIDPAKVAQLCLVADALGGVLAHASSERVTSRETRKKLLKKGPYVEHISQILKMCYEQVSLRLTDGNFQHANALLIAAEASQRGDMIKEEYIQVENPGIPLEQNMAEPPEAPIGGGAVMDTADEGQPQEEALEDKDYVPPQRDELRSAHRQE